MSAIWRRQRLGLLFVLLLGGCNPLMIPFLFQNEDPKVPAEMYDIYDKERKGQKDVKVVILTYTGLEIRPEFINADKQLTQLLAIHLQKLCKDNKEKVTIVNPSRVEEFKNNHPDWAESHMELEKVGKEFNADFVIYVEATNMSLYQPGTANQFYQGRADLRVSLVNVRKPNDLSSQQPRESTFTYPPEQRGGNMFADLDTTPQAFRMKFFNAMTKQLSGYFSERQTRDLYMGD